MYRLIEITHSNDKETQAIYPYDSRNELEGNYEFKLGTAMENQSDELLIGVDNVGKVLYKGKVGTYAFTPRLYEAKYTSEEEVDLIKCDTTELVSARYHKRKGSAIKNVDCKQEVLLGFDGGGNQIEYCHWVRIEDDIHLEPQPEPEEVEPTE